jgi:adenylate cyclase
MLRLRAFGGLMLEDQRSAPTAPVTQPRSLALLAILANSGECPISRDKVLAYLWPEIESAKAAHRLAQSLYALRHDLGVESLVRSTNDLRLDPHVIGSDLQEFTGALERGELPAALTAYRGPFLDGFYLGDASEFERWAEAERAEYRRKYRAALEALALAAGQRGDANESAEWWRRLMETDPLNAGVVVAYLEALRVAAGSTGALQFARDYGKRLREEFDSEPDPVVTAAADRLRNTSALPTGPSIAVLPFLNLTPDRENEYFSDGMTEELAGALARVPGLRVVSRTSVFALKDKGLDARQVADRLGVSYLVEGSLRKIGDRIRLNAQLVGAADGCDLWSGAYERTLEHVFALQEELSEAVVAALPIEEAAPRGSPARRPRPVLEAYTLYLRGRYAAHKRTVEGFALAAEYFEQAVEKDPGYALAHAGLAECWALRGFSEFGDLAPLEAMPKAKAAAVEALRLNPELPEGHVWLGVVRFLFDWDWAGAEREFRRALQLYPEHAYAETWYAMFLVAIAQRDEAYQRILHAHALEPLSASIRLCVARVHFMSRRFEAALDTVREILRAEPGHMLSTIWEVRCLSALERFAEALEVSQRVPPERQTPYFRSCAAFALAGLGRAEEARQVVAELRREFGAGPRFTLVIVAATEARLGNMEAALDVIWEGLHMRDGQLAFTLTQPSFDKLRGHPRFERMLAELRFPAEALARGRTVGG